MIRYLRQTDLKTLKGTALLRLDFNTEDDWRLKAATPTIKFLLKQGLKIIIFSHRGRPTGFDEQLSLKKDASCLEKLLGRKVKFINHFDFVKTENLVRKSRRKSLFVLENLRFLRGERKNNSSFARRLADLGDFYVNDAFGVSHRANASMAAITKFLPSYAGLELEQEIKILSAIRKNPKKPLVLILGGAKISDKLGLIKYFKQKAGAFLVGGAMANALLNRRGLDINQSLTEKVDKNEMALLLRYKNLFLPVDQCWANKKILDVGPRTIKLFAAKIKKARTIIWNGPLGLIENRKFEKGTLAIAKSIIKNKKAYTIAGGGETVAFLKKHRLDKKIDFVSSGGGAMLEFLAGKKLPGIEALKLKI